LSSVPLDRRGHAIDIGRRVATPTSTATGIYWRVVYRAADFEADRLVPNTLAYSTNQDGILVYERCGEHPWFVAEALLSASCRTSGS